MSQCLQCGKELEKAERAAVISGSVMGDEYTKCWYLCGACQVYTVENWREPLDAEETVWLSGPISKADGDARVKLIEGCERPWDKRCRCASHRAYFGDNLD